jgi:hypothetical protein
MDTNKYSGVSLGNPSLTIINANEADSAVYKCYGTNLVGTAETGVPMTVQTSWTV